MGDFFESSRNELTFLNSHRCGSSVFELLHVIDSRRIGADGGEAIHPTAWAQEPALVSDSLG